MKISPSRNATPEKYVRELRLRSSVSVQVYLSILNGFQRFVAEQSEDKSVSEATIRQWLNERSRVSPFHIVTDRARLVDRFLDWKVNHRELANNPFAELKMKYEQRMTTPVVRALLRPDFAAALESLRPVPRFGSFLGPVMREHVVLMQAMGHRYNTELERLLRLDRFLQGRPDLSGRSLTVVIRAWTNTRSTPQHALDCHQTARLLVNALCRIGAPVEKIPPDKSLYRQAKQQYRRPYIFSEQEVFCLLETALRFPSPRSPLRPQTLHLMLVLAYCAGLRLGEIVRLNVADFDIDDRAIEIRCTKFFKSRRLPLSESVVAALQSYLRARKEAGASTTPDAALLPLLARQRWKTARSCTPACGAETCSGTCWSTRSRSSTCLCRQPYARVVPRRHQSAVAPPLPGHVSRAQRHQLNAGLSHHYSGSSAAGQ